MTTKEEKDINEAKNVIVNPLGISLSLGIVFIIINFFLCMIISTTSRRYIMLICVIIVAIVMFVFILFLIYFLLLSGRNLIVASRIISVILVTTIGITGIFLYLVHNAGLVFENTTGYAFVSYFYKDAITKIFKFKEDIEKLNDTKYFNQNKSVLLTLFNLKNFDGLYESIKNDKGAIDAGRKYNFEFPEDKDNKDDKDDKNKDTLKNIIIVKHIIGNLGWFYISSLFATIISVKYLAYI
jgi:hypothetical protein